MIQADAKADAGHVQHGCQQAPENAASEDALHVPIVSPGTPVLLPSGIIKHLSGAAGSHYGQSQLPAGSAEQSILSYQLMYRR